MEPKPADLTGAAAEYSRYSSKGWWYWDYINYEWEAQDVPFSSPRGEYGAARTVLAEVEKRNLIEPFLVSMDTLQHNRLLPVGVPWSDQHKWIYLTADPADICRAALLTEVSDAE